MAKKRVNNGSVGLETPPNGASRPDQRPKVLNNLSDLAKLKEDMPDATEPLKNALAECFKDDEVVINSLFSHYSVLSLNATDRRKLIDQFSGGKKEIIDRMTDYFIQNLGLQNVISKIKEGGGPVEFVRHYEDVVNVLSNREVLGFYREILEKKKPTKKQAKDLAEIDRIYSEVLNLKEVEIVAPGSEKNGGKIISSRDGTPKNMNKETAPQETKPVGEKDRQRFQQILREFSDKFTQERAGQVERMRRLTGMHVGLSYDIEATRKQAEAIIAKYQESDGAVNSVAELAMREISEKLKKGNKKQEPVKEGHIASFISSEIKKELGENEKAFIEDLRELEIKERKTREIVTDYAFGKKDDEAETRIGAAIENIKDSGVKLKISPELIKKRYIAQKRYIVNELTNSIINSDENFKKILAMKKGESELDADLKGFIMSHIRKMFVQAFEWKEKPKAVASQPPENIPVVAEEPAVPEAASERDLAEMEDKMRMKFNKDEVRFRDEELGRYNRRLRRQLEKFQEGSGEVEKFKSNYIASTINVARRRGMTAENAKLLEEYMRAKLKTAIEPEEEKAPAAESATKAESPKAPSAKVEAKTERDKIILDIISREVDFFCETAPESEYNSHFYYKYDKERANYEKQGLEPEDVKLIERVFKAEREAVKARIFQFIQEEMKKRGKDISRATFKEVKEMAFQQRRKEIDEYFQKAVKGELGNELGTKKEEMETEVKFSKEELELLNSLSEVAQEVWEEELEDSKGWGGKWTTERVLAYFRPVLEANMEGVLEDRGFPKDRQRAALNLILSKIEIK